MEAAKNYHQPVLKHRLPPSTPHWWNSEFYMRNTFWQLLSYAILQVISPLLSLDGCRSRAFYFGLGPKWICANRITGRRLVWICWGTSATGGGISQMCLLQWARDRRRRCVIMSVAEEEVEEGWITFYLVKKSAKWKSRITWEDSHILLRNIRIWSTIFLHQIAFFWWRSRWSSYFSSAKLFQEP